MRDLGNRGDVEYIKARIAQGFGKHQTGVVLNCSGESRGVPGIDEGSVDAQTGQGVRQQVVTAAIQRRRSDYV